MDLGRQKEQFSLAYVHAVTSVAGFALYTPTVDDDSVDLGIAARGSYGSRRSPRLELQLKCTAKAVWRNEHLAFSLKRKNYVDLRGDDLMVPRLLVVVVVPEKIEDWLYQSDTELTLRKCGYWLSLRRASPADDVSTITVHVPEAQKFTVEAVSELMRAIGKGSPP